MKAFILLEPRQLWVMELALLPLGDELQSGCVDTVPFICGGWAVVKDVTQVGARSSINNLHSGHERDAAVFHLENVLWVHGLPKTRPACSRIELCVAGEEREASDSADICSSVLVVVAISVDGGAAEGWLRCSTERNLPLEEGQTLRGLLALAKVSGVTSAPDFDTLRSEGFPSGAGCHPELDLEPVPPMMSRPTRSIKPERTMRRARRGDSVAREAFRVGVLAMEGRGSEDVESIVDQSTVGSGSARLCISSGH
eukprot:CAMPEP_0177759580 /NCGR_PEP_ID=MMETSP0491_2-20121128/4808_1 /TAXON_ID=63592 /ORGANISM="Tetraselmis chuii, Strain PLY429" /LENGTH=254 /DNA_ID=CAMNT_0019275419 /DNA_START=73 /DNA_END=839 /DNA_ORIENTATION=+